MGAVGAVSHSFLVATDSADTLNPRATGSLLEVGDDYLRVLTGIAYGPIALSIDVVDEMPELSDADRQLWEVIEETPVKITGDLLVLDGGLDHAPDFTSVGLKRGSYHVRGFARGRDEMWDGVATDAAEHYRIVFARTTRRFRMRQLHKSDAVWNEPVTFHQLRQWYEPDPASDASAWIYIGREAYIEQQKENARMWGGRPPSHKLTVFSAAQSLAFYDRGLADAITRAKTLKQMEVGLWALREACLALGLFDRAWAAPYVAALDDPSLALDLSTFESFDALHELVQRDPDLDPNVIRLPIPGSPSNGHSAVSVLQAVNSEAVQTGKAYATFIHIEMAMTLAPEGHLDLIQRLRAKFFPRLKRAELYERWV